MHRQFVWLAVVIIACALSAIGIFASFRHPATEKNQQIQNALIISIQQDGSVNPTSAPITTADNITYTFTGDIHGQVIERRSNVVINGAGYTVQGTGNGTGITL